MYFELVFTYIFVTVLVFLLYDWRFYYIWLLFLSSVKYINFQRKFATMALGLPFLQEQCDAVLKFVLEHNYNFLLQQIYSLKAAYVDY